MRFYLIFIPIVFSFCLAHAQVGINTTNPNAAAALEVEAQQTIGFGGLQIPLVTPAQRNLINTTTASDGVLIYVDYTTNQCLEIYDGVTDSWQQITCRNNATQLIISEYVEADSDNKFVELYNPTSNAINLSNYRIVILRNGGTLPVNGSDRDILLSGSIASGDTFVIGHVGQSLVPVSSIDFVVPNAGNPLDFGGNDPVLLTDLSYNIIDIVGIPGTDPGGGYAVDGQDTENNTIRRNLPIIVPNGIWTPAEWTAFPNNDVSGLGFR